MCDEINDHVQRFICTFIEFDSLTFGSLEMEYGHFLLVEDFIQLHCKCCPIMPLVN